MILGIKGFLSTLGSDTAFSEMSDEIKEKVYNSMCVAVIPSHNEDPEAFAACVQSCLDQGLIYRVVIIDDASSDPEASDAIKRFEGQDDIDIIYFTENKGKRHGLQAGVRHAMKTYNPAVIVTVDSDTVLESGALEEALGKLWSDHRCAAVTGSVRARNWDVNFMTRLQDLRYASAFLWERAAYSRLGAVLCVCGSFTIWHADIINSYVDGLASQMFLGRPAITGDDRRLTNLALADGFTVRLAERARADTLVPENFNHWIRQQVRWAKSFIRETFWAVRHLPRGWALVLTWLELIAWIVFTAALLSSLVIAPLLLGKIGLFSWLVWISFMSWARSTKYPDARSDARAWERWYTYALAPIYGVVHLVIVLPLRLYALFTLTNQSWGTRESIEVRDI